MMVGEEAAELGGDLLRLAGVELVGDPLRLPHHLHIQALSKVTYQDASGHVRVGRGVLEQLVLGPYAPSGFKDVLDFAS
jgi:hypothetical protein